MTSMNNGSSNSKDQGKVDFGFEKVSPREKTRRVAGVFHSVAERYDLMNDVMSLGLHRLFKRMTVEMSGVRAGHTVLDLAGGSGDFSTLYSPLVGHEGRVVLSDINSSMLEVGRDRILNDGLTNVSFCQADAETLPFRDNSFECITIGFGLRNVTSKETALKELYRVLTASGVLLVLEFSKPQSPLIETAYAGFQALWPLFGKALTGDSHAYQYLVESIRMHPDQKTLKLMLQDAGFDDVNYHNLMNGVVAIHRGVKAPKVEAQPLQDDSNQG